jgi:chemotaxis protein histidine kinase CheA
MTVVFDYVPLGIYELRGVINVESEVGKVTTFTVTLPVDARQRKRASA